MAHSCPECDQVCHCNGDIDDCILDGTSEQMNCTHWQQCEQEMDERDYEDDEYEDDDFPKGSLDY